MPAKENALSPHCTKVLELLHKSHKPMGAYELLDKLHKFGIKAPPTVYRALDTLVERGLVHRIESLNAFVACHSHEEDGHGAQFAVCRSCGVVKEIFDARLSAVIATLGKELKFQIERGLLELIGLCDACRNAEA
jgi:Fur family zinc uptake transcriptional regulator